MKISRSFSSAITVLGLASGALPPTSAAAQESSKWQFAAEINGYLPAIDSKVNFPRDLGSTDIHVSVHDLLSHLKMTFMGTFDVHYDRWGVFTDVLYVKEAGNKSRTHDFFIGNVRIPATATTDLDLDLKSWVWTVAGEYRVVSDPAWRVDVLAGARMLDVNTNLGWTITGDIGPIVIPGREGTKEASKTVWDGIVGVKGRYGFGGDRRWLVPFYLDVGTGETELTWQGATGVGYRFHWGDVITVWRYIDWNADSDKTISDLNMNGPMLGVAFRF